MITPTLLARTFRLLGPATLAVVAVVATTGYSCEAPEHLTGEGVWRYWGGNLHNTHFAEGETRISVDNVASLRPKWVFAASGSVSAIPTLSETQAYFTDWGAPLGSLRLPLGGRLYAVDRATGRETWSKLIAEYAPNKLYNLSRSSPAIAGDLLIIGDLLDGPIEMLASAVGVDPGPGGTTLYAVNRATGALVWKTTLDSHPTSQLTQSPVVHDGRIYVGISSKESALAKFPYPCCTFRGSMMSVDLATGRILWKTYMVPDNGGRVGAYSGGAIWGSSPSIDSARGVVYVTTGQNYDVPAPLKECMKRNEGQPALQQSECLDGLGTPENRSNSVVALDLATGAIRWSKKLYGYDAWNFSCDPRIIPYVPSYAKNCPVPQGGDFDFGHAPMLYTTRIGGQGRDVLAVGQKTGVLWALDPDRAGDVIWSRVVGPGGIEGGIHFGAATDGRRIYVQVTNIEHTSFTLTAGREAGRVARGGIWAAVDASTGELLWQTPDPSSNLPLAGGLIHPIWGGGLGEGFFGVAMGPLTVANGVLFAGSLDKAGHMYALRGDTGEIVWRFASGGSVMSAPSIADGVLYWGSGYPVGFNNDKLYAFELPPP